MLLVVDVGNTQTHFGAYHGGELLEHWRFATVRESTSDELGAALRSLLGLRGLEFADLEPRSRPRPCQRWVRSGRDGAALLDHEMLLVGPGLKTGMAIR